MALIVALSMDQSARQPPGWPPSRRMTHPSGQEVEARYDASTTFRTTFATQEGLP
jgi:hypothetical protein